MVRVLVIDDEPDVLLLCRVNLGHAGSEVLEAQDGEHGIADAVAERPDAIVLDLMLPRIDGYEVLRTLRKDERTTLTADPGAERQGAAWRIGVGAWRWVPTSSSPSRSHRRRWVRRWNG